MVLHGILRVHMSDTGMGNRLLLQSGFIEMVYNREGGCEEAKRVDYVLRNRTSGDASDVLSNVLSVVKIFEITPFCDFTGWHPIVERTQLILSI